MAGIDRFNPKVVDAPAVGVGLVCAPRSSPSSCGVAPLPAFFGPAEAAAETAIEILYPPPARRFLNLA